MTYFSLKEARELLPEIKEITKIYYTEVEYLAKHDTAENRERVEHLLKEWVNKIVDFGVDVKGPWLVDFDSGDGYYYCWRYGEEDIMFFHRYETGFAGRRPIELLEG